jgi:Barstar (barnase inhibitor)
MSEKVEALFSGAVAPGIYRTGLRTTAASLARAAEHHGWLAFHLDGRELATKAGFLEASARALRFPSYFGHNWDAFEESLNDMSWAPAQGYLIVFDRAGQFARTQPADFAVALSILQESVARWRQQGTSLIVLLRGAGRAAGDVPRL